MHQQEIEIYKCDRHPGFYVQNICIKNTCKYFPLCCQMCQNEIHRNHTTGVDFIQINSISKYQIISENTLLQELNQFDSDISKNIKKIESVTQQINFYQRYQNNYDPQNLKIIARILRNQDVYGKFRNQIGLMVKSAKNTISELLGFLYQCLEDLIEWVEEVKENNLERIRMLIQQNKFQEASDQINNVLSKKPNQHEFQYLQIESLIRLEKQNEAALVVDQLLQQNKNNKVANFLKGQLLIKQKQNKLSIDCFNRAIAVDPKYQMAYYWKAVALFNSFRYRQAAEAIKLSIDNQNQEKHIPSYLLKIKILLKLDHYEDAYRISSSLIEQNLNIQELEELHKKSQECNQIQEYLYQVQYQMTNYEMPNIPVGRQHENHIQIILKKDLLNRGFGNIQELIKLSLEEERYEECIEYIDQYLLLDNSEQRVQFEILKAECLFLLEDLDQISDFIGQLTEKYKTNLVNLNLIKNLLLQKNQLFEALDVCEKILDIDCKDYQALKLKCRLTFMKDPKLSFAIASQLQDINPGDAFAYSIKAFYFLQTGDREQASAFAHQALAINSQDELARSILQSTQGQSN